LVPVVEWAQARTVTGEMVPMYRYCGLVEPLGAWRGRSPLADKSLTVGVCAAMRSGVYSYLIVVEDLSAQVATNLSNYLRVQLNSSG
jgi:hypothetical protein